MKAYKTGKLPWRRTRVVSRPGGRPVVAGACVAWLAASAVYSAAQGPSAQTAELHVVAWTGADEAWGRFLDAPRINNLGQVAFHAQATDDDRQESLWLWTPASSHEPMLDQDSTQGQYQSPATAQRLARTGEPAPGTAALFDRFSNLVLTDEGGLAFQADLQGDRIDASTQQGLWLAKEGMASRQLIQQGAVAPSAISDRRFSGFETQFAARSGEAVAFFARTRPKENSNEQDDQAQSSGLWVMTNDRLDVAAEADGHALPNDLAAVFSGQSFEVPFAEDPVVNAHGQSIFRGFLSGPTVNDRNGNGLWSYRADTGLVSLLRAGDEAPQTDHLRLVSFPSPPTLNDAGEAAWLAFYGTADSHHELVSSETNADASHDETLRLGLWVSRASGVAERIFSIGDAAPGLGEDAVFVDTFDPILNGAGDVLVLGVATAPNDQDRVGIWSTSGSSDGKLKLLVRTGELTPDVQSDARFGVLLPPSINAAGQAVFQGLSYISPENDESAPTGAASVHAGIWGFDRSGRLRRVVEQGQAITLDSGDVRVVEMLQLAPASGGEDGKPRGINDAGWVTFSVRFTDGSSAVLASTALTVPEPSAVSLAWIASAGALFLPYRRVEFYFPRSASRT